MRSEPDEERAEARDKVCTDGGDREKRGKPLLRSARGITLAAAAGVLLIGGYLARLTIQINRQSVIDESRSADVIVVLGAAAYRGRPSPVLKARLDHGLDLYRRDLAPRIMTTGGAGGDPDFTESGTGRAYLIRHGVPSEAIILEPEGDSTAHSTAAVGEIMRRMDLRSCIVVSDGYHIFRVKKLLEARGLEVYGSPRPTPPRNDLAHWKRCFRQAVGYVLWTIGIRI
jgi:uncharacterized SAM-binding protein YcdF (DUF218 family)